MDLKFGKLPAKLDVRTLRFETYLRKPQVPDIPITFNVDWRFIQIIESRMFLNDTFGCCVISGRANQTLRLECRETDIVPDITDEAIKAEYFKESGGADSGLYMLDSLKCWRKGWKICENSQVYTIHAFAEVDRFNQELLCAGIFLLNGLQIGFSVPQSAMDQFYSDQVWDVVQYDGGIKGGHCVYPFAYNEQGPVVWTWAKEQQTTWAFVRKYWDEVYAVVDSRNPWLGNRSPLDIEQMDRDLALIAV